MAIHANLFHSQFAISSRLPKRRIDCSARWDQEENRTGERKSPRMSRKQRTILLLVVIWSAVLGVSGVWLWRADRQERLSRQLLEAIKREDTPAALMALKQGADADVREEPSVPTWQRLWDLVWRRQAKQSTAPTALL